MTPKRNISKRISLAPSSSTSTRSPIIRRICRICCRSRRNLPARWNSSVSATECALSFMILQLARRRARLVDLADIWRGRRKNPGGRPAALEGRGPAPRTWPRAASAPAVHGEFQQRRCRRCRTGAESKRNGRRADPRCARGRAVQRRGAEPRPGLRSGHIPGSLNLPWAEVVAAGEIKPKDEAKILLAQAGVDFTRPVITTCGSGVTAAILLLALATAGKRDVILYDGSWAEWGRPPRSSGGGK